MLRILNKRYPLVKVRLLPVRVQGAEAPGEIVAAIRYANQFKLADLLIVGRGGGSIEDLWAFNDELVARAIYASDIPVISAVGHEPDVTISDYVADLRAATPSNAAELAVPDQDALRQTMDSMVTAMETALSRQLKASRRQLEMLASSPALISPVEYLHQRRNILELLENRLTAAQSRNVHLLRQRYLTATAKLDALSPLKVLSRGYAMAQTGEGTVVRSIGQINVGDEILLKVSDGEISANVCNVKEDAI